MIRCREICSRVRRSCPTPHSDKSAWPSCSLTDGSSSGSTANDPATPWLTWQGQADFFTRTEIDTTSARPHRKLIDAASKFNHDVARAVTRNGSAAPGCRRPFQISSTTFQGSRWFEPADRRPRQDARHQGASVEVECHQAAVKRLCQPMDHRGSSLGRSTSSWPYKVRSAASTSSPATTACCSGSAAEARSSTSYAATSQI